MRELPCCCSLTTISHLDPQINDFYINLIYLAFDAWNLKVSRLTFFLSSSYLFPNSVKPLWHLMAFTSVVMYTTNYICLKGKLFVHVFYTV